jgi:phage shock protein A
VAQSILGRIGQLVRANVNQMLDQAEDPEKMLDQLIRDFTSNIAEAEQAVAQTVGELRLLEDDRREAEDAAQEWGSKAAAAARRAQELQGQGSADASKFQELAKVALRRQISFEQQLTTMNSQIAQQTELTDKLKSGLDKLRFKREELVRKRDELVSRAKMAAASRQVQEAVRDVSIMDPTSDLNRFEERIRREEAMARGMEEVASSNLDEQFAQLEDTEDDLEVEARLAELQSGTSGGQLGAGSTAGSTGS